MVLVKLTARKNTIYRGRILGRRIMELERLYGIRNGGDRKSAGIRMNNVLSDKEHPHTQEDAESRQSIHRWQKHQWIFCHYPKRISRTIWIFYWRNETCRISYKTSARNSRPCRSREHFTFYLIQTFLGIIY